MSKPRPIAVTISGGRDGGAHSLRTVINLAIVGLGGKPLEENYRQTRFMLHGVPVRVVERDAKKRRRK